MRLFIAIDLPQDVKEYLRKLQSFLVSPDRTKIFLTHDFHVTLKFLGSCSEDRRKEIEKKLARLSVDFHSFDSQLTKIGTFGGRYPRVVWVGITSPVWLKDFARSVGNEDDFVPHITLARIKGDLSKISVEPMKFRVEDFCLFESRLSSKGAVHIKLSTFRSQQS